MFGPCPDQCGLLWSLISSSASERWILKLAQARADTSPPSHQSRAKDRSGPFLRWVVFHGCSNYKDISELSDDFIEHLMKPKFDEVVKTRVECVSEKAIVLPERQHVCRSVSEAASDRGVQIHEVPTVGLNVSPNTRVRQPALELQECIPPSAIGSRLVCDPVSDVGINGRSTDVGSRLVCDPVSDVGINGRSTDVGRHFEDTRHVVHLHIPSNIRVHSGSQQSAIPVRSPSARDVPNINRSCARSDRTRWDSAVGNDNLSSQMRASGPPVGYSHIGGCDHSCQYCGALFWYEERVKNNARGVRPRYNGYCKGGRVVLPTYEIYPEYIKTLLEDRHFLENIRAYNQMFSMTSLGAHIDESINNGRGPTPREKFEDTNILNFKPRLYNVIGAREYELHIGDMLGAIVYDGGPEDDMDYDIVLEERSGHPQRVHKLHPSYMSLQFSFLFLYGQDGYQKEMKLIGSTSSSSQQKRLTMLPYYSYYLHDRANRYNYLSRAGRCSGIYKAAPSSDRRDKKKLDARICNASSSKKRTDLTH
ncbi:hypothetical protein Tco_0123412 [Tanacetum coccineum]